MKILMCNAFYYERGGCEIYTFALSRELEAHGHTVVPFSMSHERNLPSEYERYFVSNIDFSDVSQASGLSSKIRAAARVLYSSEAKSKIQSLIEKTKPDLAHLHNVAHHLSPSILPGIKRYGLPIVQTLHDYKLICPSTLLFSGGEICERCRGKRYYNAILRRCKRGSVGASVLAAIELYAHRLSRIYENNVDVFVAPSRFLRDKMMEFKMDGREIIHIPQLIDVGTYSPCYEHQDYLIYFGRLSAEKGVCTLLEAMRRLRGARLYVAGEGPLKRDLMGQVADARNIEFLGHVPHNELKGLVKNAMFAVVPSECYDNAPMSVYEAFALGKPVIGSRIGGIPELIQHGENGLLFEPGNAGDLADTIDYLAGHKSLIQHMGKNARAGLEQRHSKAKHYEAVTNVYRKLLRGK